MCTVSVVPDRDGFRLVCNRDERRERPEALPPAWRPVGCRTAIYPVDPIGPGTWIGVNDVGLAGVILNHTPRGAGTRVTSGKQSRGLILPRLFEERTLTAAADAAGQLNLSAFDLFRVLLIEDDGAILLTSDGSMLAQQALSLERPLMLTSSSLGDAVVDAPRRQLFDTMLGECRGSWLRKQDRFHAHRWPMRPDLSVTMARRDARTVSRVAVSVTCEGIRLRYSALADAHERAREVA